MPRANDACTGQNRRGDFLGARASRPQRAEGPQLLKRAGRPRSQGASRNTSLGQTDSASGTTVTIDQVRNVPDRYLGRSPSSVTRVITRR